MNWKFWNRRPKIERGFELGSEPFFDLDAIVGRPIPFRLHGKSHKLMPLELDEFLRVSNGFAALRELAMKDSRSGEELRAGYFALFSAACPTISPDDVAEMSQAQCAALGVQITNHITGRKDPLIETALTGSAEKKSLKFSAA